MVALFEKISPPNFHKVPPQQSKVQQEIGVDKLQPPPLPLLGGEWLPPEDACTKNVHELVFADVSFVFVDVSLAVSIA